MRQQHRHLVYLQSLHTQQRYPGWYSTPHQYIPQTLYQSRRQDWFTASHLLRSSGSCQPAGQHHYFGTSSQFCRQQNFQHIPPPTSVTTNSPSLQCNNHMGVRLTYPQPSCNPYSQCIQPAVHGCFQNAANPWGQQTATFQHQQNNQENLQPNSALSCPTTDFEAQGDSTGSIQPESLETSSVTFNSTESESSESNSVDEGSSESPDWLENLLEPSPAHPITYQPPTPGDTLLEFSICTESPASSVPDSSQRESTHPLAYQPPTPASCEFSVYPETPATNSLKPSQSGSTKHSMTYEPPSLESPTESSRPVSQLSSCPKSVASDLPNKSTQNQPAVIYKPPSPGPSLSEFSMCSENPVGLYDPSGSDCAQIPEKRPVTHDPPSPDLRLPNVPTSNGNPADRSPEPQIVPSGSLRVLKRPPIGYRELAARAITSSPHGSMKVQKIYDWIQERYPYYKETTTKWKHSVRSALAKYNCFVPDEERRIKINHAPWKIHPSYVQDFKRGHFSVELRTDDLKAVEVNRPARYVSQKSSLWSGNPHLDSSIPWPNCRFLSLNRN